MIQILNLRKLQRHRRSLCRWSLAEASLSPNPKSTPHSTLASSQATSQDPSSQTAAASPSNIIITAITITSHQQNQPRTPPCLTKYPSSVNHEDHRPHIHHSSLPQCTHHNISIHCPSCQYYYSIIYGTSCHLSKLSQQLPRRHHRHRHSPIHLSSSSHCRTSR